MPPSVYWNGKHSSSNQSFVLVYFTPPNLQRRYNQLDTFLCTCACVPRPFNNVTWQVMYDAVFAVSTAVMQTFSLFSLFLHTSYTNQTTCMELSTWQLLSMVKTTGSCPLKVGRASSHSIFSILSLLSWLVYFLYIPPVLSSLPSRRLMGQWPCATSVNKLFSHYFLFRGKLWKKVSGKDNYITALLIQNIVSYITLWPCGYLWLTRTHRTTVTYV